MSKKIIALVLALALLVTVFAACGGDGGSSTSSQTESSNTEESSQAEESSTAEESSEGEAKIFPLPQTASHTPGFPCHFRF